MAADANERTHVLGVRISALDLNGAVDEVARLINFRERSYICVASVHGVMEAQHSQRLENILEQASMVLPDGKPLSVILKAQGLACEQIRGADFTHAILARSVAMGWSHYFYGTTPSNLADLTTVLRRDYPGLKIAGAFAPPFRPLDSNELDSISEVINAAAADIVWVGLSTPKQEYWMASARPTLSASVLVGVGAVFDFLGGHKRQAPQALRRLGLEWLYRMAQEPRRLGPRYLRSNPAFVSTLVWDYFSSRRLYRACRHD